MGAEILYSQKLLLKYFIFPRQTHILFKETTMNLQEQETVHEKQDVISLFRYSFLTCDGLHVLQTAADGLPATVQILRQAREPLG